MGSLRLNKVLAPTGSLIEAARTRFSGSPHIRHIDVVEALVRLRQVEDTLDQAGDRTDRDGNDEDSQHEVYDARSRISQLELVDPEGTQEDSQHSGDYSTFHAPSPPDGGDGIFC